MLENKYSTFLTIILIIVIVAIIGLLAFLGYDFYKKYASTKEAQTVADQFEESVKNEIEEEGTTEEGSQQQTIENPFAQTSSGEQTTTQEGGSSSGSSGTTPQEQNLYKGYPVIGVIEIPKTNIKYPILDSVTKGSLEISISRLKGLGPDQLNQPGNVILYGHNYKNGLFFSKNNQLEIGDAVYITDITGNRVKYTIYNKYVTDPQDTEFMVRDTEGRVEVSLQTCTDDAQNRIIIWAKAD